MRCNAGPDSDRKAVSVISNKRGFHIHIGETQTRSPKRSRPQLPKHIAKSDNDSSNSTKTTTSRNYINTKKNFEISKYGNSRSGASARPDRGFQGGGEEDD
jgi:hypothetical protein